MPRDPQHDYKSPCIYHITIRKSPTVPLFCSISGTLVKHKIDYSAVGYAVKNGICNLPRLESSLKPLQYVVMPDHVHILLHVQKYLKHHLGAYISQMKIGIFQKLRDRQIINESVFEDDYYDRILRPWQSLQVIFNYIRDNPHRLLARMLHRDYFRRDRHILDYGGLSWQAYGNLDLLDNPFKEPVVCHTGDSEMLRRLKIERWDYSAGNGGVLISPFISQDEKHVKNHALEKGGKIIHIVNEKMDDRYKPGGLFHRLCEEGRMVIIAPHVTIPPVRSSFLLMNGLAEWIAYKGI